MYEIREKSVGNRCENETMLIIFLVEQAINKPEVKGILLTGGRLFEEIRSNEKFHELLKNNMR